MMKLGLIGKNISHSQSESIYRSFLSDPFEYQLLDYSELSLIPSPEQLFKRFDGLSITSPYKQHFLNNVLLSPSAERTRAINCLYSNEDGTIAGANTDYLALNMLIPEYIQKQQLNGILCLGKGVMASVIRLIASELKIHYQQFDRDNFGDLSSLDLSQRGDLANMLVVNCCSRTMLFAGSLASGSHFYDLNYGLDHPFLREFDKKSYRDGLELLKKQAQIALDFWKLLPDKNL